ncbi:MAG: PAS domain S-box protein [Pseudomonadota bacterium]|nr:PAS domain S-box protein [Pseudomonadota bacterium]
MFGAALLTVALSIAIVSFWSLSSISERAIGIGAALALLGFAVFSGRPLFARSVIDARDQREKIWTPLLAAGIVIIGSIMGWDATRKQLAQSQDELSRLYLLSVEQSLDSALQNRFRALQRLAERLARTASAVSEQQLHDELATESASYLRDFSSLQGISWRAADFSGNYVISRPHKLRMREQSDLEKHWSELLRAARQTRSQQTSEAVHLGDGDAGILVVFPAISEGEVRGYLLAEIAFPPLFAKTLDPIAAPASMRILDSGKPIYTRGDFDSVPVFRALLPARLGAMRVEFRQSEDAGYRFLPELLLLAEIIMGGVFATALHFAALSRERARLASAMRADVLLHMAEREQAQEKVGEIADEMHAVLDSTSDAVYFLDNDWRFAYLNAQAQALLHDPDRALIGKSIWAEYPELVGTKLEQQYREAMTEQRTMDFSIYLKPLSAWFNLRVYPHPRGLAIYFQDITQRRAAELAIGLSESRFRNVARATADAVWDWNLQTNALWWSDGLHRLFGHSPESIQADISSWTQRIHPDDQPSVVAGIQAVIDSGAEMWSDEYRFVRSDGSYAYVTDRGFVIRDGSGRPLRMVGGMTDVTERRLDVERLRDSEEYLRAILDASLEGIITINEWGSIVSANSAIEKIFGCTAGDIIDRSISALMPEADRQWHDSFLAKHGVTSVVRLLGSSREVHGLRRNGNIFPMELSVTEVHRAGRRLFTGFIRDITLRREAEQALRKSMSDLDSRNRELQDFAFVASHDLQEPLRKIRMFSDRLLREYAAQLDERANEYLKRNVQAGIRMQTLIDDLLAYSRIATRSERFTEVDLNRLLTTVVDDLDARIESSGGKVEWNALPTVVGDATQLRQLFQNLIANALKFHHPERASLVSISAQALDSGKATSGWLIRVEDNGIGFANEHAERIFAPFHRLHGRSEYEGTGIGLAIVQRIVEHHGGSISAIGRPGLGATFTIVLPMHPQPSPSTTPLQ